MIQQSRAPIPRIMAFIHPLIQDTKLGLVSVHRQPICPQQDTLTMSLSHSLSDLLGHALYQLGPSAPDL